MVSIFRVLPKGKPYIMVSLGPHVLYSEKDGHLVLRNETSWKKISGLMINTKKGCLWFYFRRSQLRRR